MSFYTPEIGIEHYDEIPVLCSKCIGQSTWTGLSQKTKEALIHASSYHSFTAELLLLNRVDDLISHFPDTKLPLIYNKRRIAKKRICLEFHSFNPNNGNPYSDYDVTTTPYEE